MLTKPLQSSAGSYLAKPLGSVEYDTIDGCIDDVLTELGKIVSIPDRDDIPNLYFETVARILSIYAAAEFSNQPLDIAAIQTHEQRLRYLIANTPTYEVIRAQYF